MSESSLNYHDDNTYATSPGRVSLSLDKLKNLHPELFTLRTRILDLIPQRLRSSMRATQIFELLEEHLTFGDSSAAIVVSTEPYLVATYTRELDCVAILRFRPESVASMNTKVGSKLITVNTYTDKHDTSGHPDLTFGPNYLGRYSDFWPIIADFLTDDIDQLARLKSEIQVGEWRRIQKLSEHKLADTTTKIRYGHPLFSHRMAT